MSLVYLKGCLTRLKNSFAYRSVLNNLFLIVFFVLLLLLSFINRIVFIILILYSFFLYRKDKEYGHKLLRYSLIVGLVVIANYLYLELSFEIDSIPYTSGMVIEVNKKETYQRLTIKNGKFKNYVYEYDFIEINVGDIIEVEGKVLPSEEARIEGAFNYREFLKQRRINKTISCEELRFVGSGIHIGIVRDQFLRYLEENFEGLSLTFLKAMVIGDDGGFSDEFRKAITDNGILHLFAISGSHIALFVLLITQVLNKLGLKEKTIDIITCVLLIIYLVLTSFQASVVRSALMYFFLLLNKKFKLGFSAVDVLSFCFIVLIIINPYYIYDLGFILSFLAAGLILLIAVYLDEQGHFIQLFMISLFVMIITLPVVININNEINILSPITNVIFIDLVEGMILPISIVVLIFPPLKILYEYLIIAFYNFTIFISNKIMISISFPDFSIISSIIYYSLLFFIVQFYNNRKLKNLCITLLCSFLLILSNQTIFQGAIEVDFLDLYNGEAILIRDANNSCNALIDTGDGSNNEVTSFIKSIGVKKLDMLIITHNHLDHNGEAEYIINEIRVNNLILSAYDSSTYSLNSNTDIIRVKENDRLSCGNLEFLVLHPDRNYLNENDNSIVLYSKIGEYGFLFLGDITKSAEERLPLSNLSVDVVKIAHHGSKTSTSPIFIEKVKPKYAIIQSGRIEKFGFPHDEVIDTLNYNNVIILSTDKLYSIKYQYRQKKSIFTSKSGKTNLVH